MEHTTTPPRPKHLGRKVRHMRELLNFTQDEIAEKMGVSQQTVSHIESSETVNDDHMEKVARALGVSAEAIKDLNEEATVYNIVTNNSNNESVSGQNIHCTFNPIDKLMEAIEKNEKLYEKLLKSEQEKVAMLQKMMEGK